MTVPQDTPQVATPTAADRAATAWNLAHAAVGTRVDLISANGTRWPTTTRSPAHVRNGRALVAVADWPGGWEIGVDVRLPDETPGGAA